MDKSLEEKIEELWNREQIKSLTYAYGECILQGDARGMANLFTEDGFVDFSARGQGKVSGRDAITQLYMRTSIAHRIRPFFTNHYIEFIDKTHARGWCYFDNRGVENGESLIGAGKVYDEYRLVDGRWYFGSRRVAPFFIVSLRKGWAEALG